jgi:hypothetical protein
VAASGGWLDGHTLRAEVIFLETPHQMDITCSLPRRTAEAVWRHPPLTPARSSTCIARLGTPRAQPPTAARWQFIHERPRDSRQKSAC